MLVLRSTHLLNDSEHLHSFHSFLKSHTLVLRILAYGSCLIEITKSQNKYVRVLVTDIYFPSILN